MDTRVENPEDGGEVAAERSQRQSAAGKGQALRTGPTQRDTGVCRRPRCQGGGGEVRRHRDDHLRMASCHQTPERAGR